MTTSPDIENGALIQLFEGFDLYNIQPEKGSDSFKMDGNNANGVAVVYKGIDTMGADDIDQLNKILAALKLNPADITSINIEDVPAPVFASIAQRTQCKYMLVFGGTPADLGMLVAAKRYIELNLQGVKVLFSDSLPVLRNDAQRKRYLWDCLQITFGLKQQ